MFDKTHFIFCLLIFVLLCVITDTVVRTVERRLRQEFSEEIRANVREFDAIMTTFMKEQEGSSSNLDYRLKDLEKWQHEVDEHLLKLTDGYYGKLIKIEEDKMI